MKSSLTIFAIFLSLFSSAQQLDTISIGAGYTQQVWYGLESDKETKSSGATWDLAFSMRSRKDAAIWVNPNATLYKAVTPIADWSIFNNVDTLTLTPQYGVDSAWAMGAFNRTGDNSLDYGWGTYNPVNHNVKGDSVYVIKSVAGKWYKIMIERLALDTSFFFKIADLNGTNEKSIELKKSDYKDRLMGYYSLANNAALNREPSNKEWDLTAWRYYGLTPDNTGALQSYPLTGILQNDGVLIAKVVKRDTANDNTTGLKFQNRINVIGADWKSFDLTAGWKVADSTAYFVKTLNGKVYKLILTRFGGNSTGNMIFKREQVATTSSTNDDGSKATFGIYPNPTRGDNITLLYDIKTAAQSIDFQLINLAGQVVYRQKLQNNEGGFTQQTLPNLNVPKGFYVAYLQWGGKFLSHKVIIQD
jgi:Secretion system C-terminal sorting domain